MTEESIENGYSVPNINSPLKIVFIRNFDNFSPLIFYILINSKGPKMCNVWIFVKECLDLSHCKGKRRV